jgi:hypothetical protein
MVRTMRTIPDFDDDAPAAIQVQPIEAAPTTLTKPAEKQKAIAPGLDLQRQLITQKDATAGWKSVVFIMAAANIGLSVLSLLGIYGVYTSQFIIKRDVKSVGRYGKPDSHTCRAN